MITKEIIERTIEGLEDAYDANPSVELAQLLNFWHLYNSLNVPQ